MNYGLYLSASGTMTALHKQAVIANNLANMQTVGFKPDAIDTRQRLPERLEGPVASADPKRVLERLGGGPGLHASRIEMTQGNLTKTANPLDLAIRGDGFFVVDASPGGAGTDLRLSRDGRMTIRTDGTLVMSNNDMPVLDDRHRTIRVTGEGEIAIDGDGTIRQGERTLGRLALAAVNDATLVKDGRGLLRSDAIDSERRATGTVEQAHLESSAVDPVLALNRMIQISHAIQWNTKLMQYHDHAMGEAINTVGRVA